MWKSTSLASVSQYRTKRIDGSFSADAAGLAQAPHDLAAARPVGADPGRRDQAEVLAQDLGHAAEAALRVLARQTVLEGGERLLVLALPHQREGEQAVAGRVIGALLGGAGVGVGGQGQRGVAGQAIEPLAGEAAQVGALREQVDDRAVGARRPRRVALCLERLAERDQRHHVAGRLGPPRRGRRDRLVDLLAAHQPHHVAELAGVRVDAGLRDLLRLTDARLEVGRALGAGLLGVPAVRDGVGGRRGLRSRHRRRGGPRGGSRTRVVGAAVQIGLPAGLSAGRGPGRGCGPGLRLDPLLLFLRCGARILLRAGQPWPATGPLSSCRRLIAELLAELALVELVLALLLLAGLVARAESGAMRR